MDFSHFEVNDYSGIFLLGIVVVATDLLGVPCGSPMDFLWIRYRVSTVTHLT